jgi:hypothetical protein
MQKVNDHILKVGSRVYSILYGGRDGIVFSIYGEQTPDSVVQMGSSLVSRGGSASFDIVFSNGDVSRALPESIGMRPIIRVLA